MKKLIIPLIAIFAIALTAPDLSARKRGRMHGPGHIEKGHHRGMFFGDPEKMKEKLGLSDEQVTKIGEINLEYKKKLIKIREKLEPKRLKLKGMLLEDNVDLDTIRDLLKEMSELQIEIRMLRITQRLDIEKILTPEQKVKLKSMPMHKGRGRMGPPPPDGDPEMDF